MAEDRFSAVRSPRYSGGRALGFRGSSLPPSPGQSAAQATRAQPAIAGFDAPRSRGFVDGGGDPSTASPGVASPEGVSDAVAEAIGTAVGFAATGLANAVGFGPVSPAIGAKAKEFTMAQMAPAPISEMAMAQNPTDVDDATFDANMAALTAPEEAANLGIVGVDAPMGAPDSAPATADAAADAAAAGGAVGPGVSAGDAAGGVSAGDAAAADGASAASASGGGDGGGGACFITEAVMAAGGQGDQAPELEILRSFRDQVMMSNPVGQMLVQQYYTIAPLVVEAVSARPDGMQIFQAIKGEYIDKAIQHIQAGQMEEALRCYAEMIAFTTPFAIEATMGPGGQPDDEPAPGQEPLDDFATDAAMVAQSPEMAAQATGAQPSVPPIGGQMPGSYTGPMANPPQQPAISGMFARPQPPMQQQPRRY